MTKRKQTLIERRAKRLGEILRNSEQWGGTEIIPEILFEKAFLTCWLRRELAWNNVLDNNWAWK